MGYLADQLSSLLGLFQTETPLSQPGDSLHPCQVSLVLQLQEKRSPSSPPSQGPTQDKANGTVMKILILLVSPRTAPYPFMARLVVLREATVPTLQCQSHGLCSSQGTSSPTCYISKIPLPCLTFAFLLFLLLNNLP